MMTDDQQFEHIRNLINGVSAKQDLMMDAQTKTLVRLEGVSVKVENNTEKLDRHIDEDDDLKKDVKKLQEDGWKTQGAATAAGALGGFLISLAALLTGKH